MSKNVQLIGGPGDGAFVPALNRVVFPVPTEISMCDPADTPSVLDYKTVIYQREKIALPFDPERDDAVRHVPQPHPEKSLIWWTVNVWPSPTRREAIELQIKRVNDAAKKCGGYLLLQKEPRLAKWHERATFEWHKARFLALLQPNFEEP